METESRQRLLPLQCWASSLPRSSPRSLVHLFRLLLVLASRSGDSGRRILAHSQVRGAVSKITGGIGDVHNETELVAPLAVLSSWLHRSTPRSLAYLFRLLSLALAYPLWQFWPADTGSFARFAGAVRAKGMYETIGELEMFTTKLNLVAPLAFAVLGVIAASIEPALAGLAPVPAPLIGAGLPLWRFWPADTGSFASFAGAVRATASTMFVQGKLSSQAALTATLAQAGW